MQTKTTHSLWSRIRPVLSSVKQKLLVPVNVLRQLSIRPFSALHGGPDAAIGLLHQRYDLTPEVVLAGYARGIFPTGEPGDKIVWHSPSERGVIACDQVHVSRRLKGYLRKDQFEIRFDTSFAQVLEGCADRENTWITEEISDVYRKLHAMGFAHSVEAFQDGRLIGGGYGIALGKMFFLESMFCRENHASKVAFVKLAEKLQRDGFLWIDCQYLTEHWKRFGAKPMSRPEFLTCVVTHLNEPAQFTATPASPPMPLPVVAMPTPQQTLT